MTLIDRLYGWLSSMAQRWVRAHPLHQPRALGPGIRSWPYFVVAAPLLVPHQLVFGDARGQTAVFGFALLIGLCLGGGFLLEYARRIRAYAWPDYWNSKLVTRPAVAGDVAGARAAASRIQAELPAIGPYYVAQLHGLLEEWEAALACLEEADIAAWPPPIRYTAEMIRVEALAFVRPDDREAVRALDHNPVWHYHGAISRLNIAVQHGEAEAAAAAAQEIPVHADVCGADSDEDDRILLEDGGYLALVRYHLWRDDVPAAQAELDRIRLPSALQPTAPERDVDHIEHRVNRAGSRGSCRNARQSIVPLTSESSDYGNVHAVLLTDPGGNETHFKVGVELEIGKVRNPGQLRYCATREPEHFGISGLEPGEMASQDTLIDGTTHRKGDQPEWVVVL